MAGGQTGAALFAPSGYTEISNRRLTQEGARAFFVASLRKMAGNHTSIVGGRLVLDLLEVPHMRVKNAKGPLIEDVQIPTKMKKWAPSLALLAGIWTPGQEMANHFAIELTRGDLEIPPYTPFLTAGLSTTPRRPSGPAFGGSREARGESNCLIKDRRPNRSLPNPSCPITCGSYLTWASLLRGGDLGGLAAQISQLGAHLAISNSEKRDDRDGLR